MIHPRAGFPPAAVSTRLKPGFPRSPAYVCVAFCTLPQKASQTASNRPVAIYTTNSPTSGEGRLLLDIDFALHSFLYVRRAEVVVNAGDGECVAELLPPVHVTGVECLRSLRYRYPAWVRRVGRIGGRSMDGVALVHPFYCIADFDLYWVGHVFRWRVEHLYLHGLRRECRRRDAQRQRTSDQQHSAEHMYFFHSLYVSIPAYPGVICYCCSSLERRNWTLNRARRFQIAARTSLFRVFGIDSERIERYCPDNSPSEGYHEKGAHQISAQHTRRR